MKNPQHISVTSYDDRSGTTLSEVLISLLVMSVGVVSVAALFPIAVLRSVQATQLTNAANLRHNVEAFTRILPQVVNVGPDWQPVTNYVVNDLVVAQTETRRKTPSAVFECIANHTSPGLEPDWNFRNGGLTPLGGPGVTSYWRTYSLNNYVVDPLGWHLVDPGNALGLRRYLGNRQSTAAFHSNVYRFASYGALNETIATRLAALPDSWVQHGESLQFAIDNTVPSVTLQDLNENLIDSVPAAYYSSTPNSNFVRLTFIDADNKASHTRYVNGLTGTGTAQTVSWTNALPAGFVPARIRVEVYDRRFTWMLSVRRGAGGSAQMDCVVFFNRSYGVEDENVVSAVFRKEIGLGADGGFGNVGVDDDNNGTTDNPEERGWPGSDDSPRNFVIVQYNSANDPPFYKKGGYVCDATNLRWYRIIDTAEASTNIPAAWTQGFTADVQDSAADRFVRLTLEVPIVETAAQTTTVSGIDRIGGALMMRGIVDVFPLRAQLPWEE